MASRFDPNQMHFFYNGEYLGSCDTDYIECPKLLELMNADSRVASQILTYMNSLGDPVFSTEPGGYEAETDVSKVDIEDLYNTFMQELDYSYRDFPDQFCVGGDYLLPDFEIFVGPVAEENVKESAVESSTSVSTDPGLKYADKVTYEDVYPSDTDISFFFTGDDAAYAKSLFPDVADVAGFTVQISLPKTTPWDYNEAFAFVSPTIINENGDKSDIDFTDITYDISDADLKKLVEMCEAEYDKWGNS